MSTDTRRRRVRKADEVRLDYAWKWFSFHAEQRTKMFNYMILALGLLATAIVGALNSKLPVVAAILSFAASLLAAVFFLIDTRNRHLYGVANDVLVRMESELLFGASPTVPDGPTVPLTSADSAEPTVSVVPTAAATKAPEPSDEAMAWRMRENDRRTRQKSRLRETLLGQHRFWMPFVILGLASLFAIVGGLLAAAASHQGLRTEGDRKGTIGPCCTAICGACIAQPAASAPSAVSAPATASAPSAASSAARAVPGTGAVLLFAFTGLVGLALLVYGVVRWRADVGETLGALCFTYAFALVVLSILWFLVPVSWRWAGEGSPIDQRTAACDVLVQCGGSDQPRRDPIVLRSERVGGFSSGSAEIACSSLPQLRAIESLRAAIHNAYARNQDALVLLVGATDRDPLSAALRRRYESNAGLARARVEAAGECLQLAKLIGPSGKPPDVIRVVSGPRFTPENAPDRAVAAAEMEADREVQALVLGVPVRSAAVNRP